MNPFLVQPQVQDLEVKAMGYLRGLDLRSPRALRVLLAGGPGKGPWASSYSSQRGTARGEGKAREGVVVPLRTQCESHRPHESGSHSLSISSVPGTGPGALSSSGLSAVLWAGGGATSISQSPTWSLTGGRQWSQDVQPGLSLQPELRALPSCLAASRSSGACILFLWPCSVASRTFIPVLMSFL